MTRKWRESEFQRGFWVIKKKDEERKKPLGTCGRCTHTHTHTERKWKTSASTERRKWKWRVHEPEKKRSLEDGTTNPEKQK